ncbi:MAG: FAD/NAD(P)-binding protein [archaeon]
MKKATRKRKSNNAVSTIGKINGSCADNDLVPRKHRLVKIVPLSPDTTLFRIDCGMSHMPGQFVQASVLGVGEAPVSISSWSDKYLDLSVRRVGNVTGAMHHMKVGHAIGIRGPFGNGFPMKELEGKNLILLGGGCGVAPMRGVVEYLAKNRKKYGEVDLLFGFRSYDDILFKKEGPKWKKSFNVYLTLDRGSTAGVCSEGTVVDLLSTVKPSNKNAAVMICGPHVMMKYSVLKLKELGFKEEQIYVSLERLMQCGNGRCGHCMVGGKYVCKDGPVFRFDEAKLLED